MKFIFKFCFIAKIKHHFPKKKSINTRKRCLYSLNEADLSFSNSEVYSGLPKMFKMERFAVVKHDTLGFLPLSYHQGLYTLSTPTRLRNTQLIPSQTKKLALI